MDARPRQRRRLRQPARALPLRPRRAPPGGRDLTRLSDVTAIDGLEREADAARVAELVERLVAAGITRVAAAGFLPASAGRPAGDEVAARLSSKSGVVQSGLVLDGGGLARLLRTPLNGARVPLPATEFISRQLLGRALPEARRSAVALVAQARRAGLWPTAVVEGAFGCPIEGKVDLATIAGLAEEATDAGAKEVVLVDSIGAATPGWVREVVSATVAAGFAVGVHCHDTRRTGYACAWVAAEAGAMTVEAALGGLGRTAFAPGCPGNLATEDLAAMLAADGLAVDADPEAVAAAARWLVPDGGAGGVGRLGLFPLEAVEGSVLVAPSRSSA
jgi:hydroxymethylglutaryl-CoA lyase